MENQQATRTQDREQTERSTQLFPSEADKRVEGRSPMKRGLQTKQTTTKYGDCKIQRKNMNQDCGGGYEERTFFLDFGQANTPGILT